MSDLLTLLNTAQRSAVCSEKKQQLVLAGAGSGKTRVLVHRLAWLLEEQDTSPYQLLAVTFTNKAANEMRQRAEHLLHYSANSMWIGTFHGIAHRLLRKHWYEAGLNENFQIIDSADQQRMIKRIIHALELDEKTITAKLAQWFINKQKDQGIRAQDVDSYDYQRNPQLVDIYTEYQRLCDQAHLVDFAELLLRSHELWLQHPSILAHYQQRLQHLLVDEFQDTNTIQYAWLQLLVGQQGRIMVVGDDDQSIYGWRGANASHIQRFCDEYPDADIIRLEQNYRSTQTILNAANAVIAENEQRLGKDLWTEGSLGQPIQCYHAFNEMDEANFIVQHIVQLMQHTTLYQHIAILYRSNAQSRILEDALINAHIPYRIYGGLRFFERTEIKDALAYCRLSTHHHDDTAFERIVNLPTRGIGERTLLELRTIAQQQTCSLWQASHLLVNSDTLTKRARHAVHEFLQLIEQLTEDTQHKLLAEHVDYIIQHSGLIAHYQRMTSEKGQFRVDNLRELVSSAAQYQAEHSNEQYLMNDFLAHATLDVGDTQASEHDDYVQLMTLHSAKGLEFPIVFICGMEQELFPRIDYYEDPERFEEERRLCYVGITRAMHTLYMTYAKRRRLYQDTKTHTLSCFVKDIPSDCIQHINLNKYAYQAHSTHTQHDVPATTQYVTKTSSGQHTQQPPFCLGQTVTHPSFGEGTITSIKGQGAHTQIQVKFSQQGSKWLVLSHAPISPN